MDNAIPYLSVTIRSEIWYDADMKKPTFTKFLLQFIAIIICATLVVVFADKIL